VIDPTELRDLIVDKYTSAELVELLDMSIETLLDFIFEECYNSDILFDDLGVNCDDDEEDTEVTFNTTDQEA
jgi:ribosome assembly protein YihI (activator of Der GTPase)